MEWNDTIYLSLLLISIGFGHFIRQVEDVVVKKWVSTFTGIVLVYIVSGLHIIHPLICTALNGFIITCLPLSCFHLVSFIFTFGYLFFFRTTVYFGVEYPPAHTNAVQMMLTLKLVGLAFEVNEARKMNKKNDEGNNEDQWERTTPLPGFMDIFHYSFCYAGVLTGPYFRYRTYLDFLHTPFAKYANCLEATVNKLKYVPMYAALFLISGYVFPLKYAEEEEFYIDRSVLYRIWYLTPCFFNFRMRIYSGFVLSECACIMAGVGAYPSVGDSKPGRGPAAYKLVKQMSSDPKKLENVKYDFETVHNIDPYRADFVCTFREAMKTWNMAVQYWLAIHVYKRTPRSIRLAATMFMSSIWHGVYAGYYLCLCSVPFYLPVEDLYDRLFRKEASGLAREMYDWMFWFTRMQAFSYMGIAFLLLDVKAIIRYWSSIYFVGHALTAIAYVIGVCFLKMKKTSSHKK
ncbi:lysophospholipid acyltransferase 7-like [Ischnura elegans]|uniref:lysophospholipid acyltransferase 7-like n=1 Tax=Ischnura elegans TaxID=197161 RepID=UPI001ED86D13|nr:lysophospholipid acyltransferase 7-like [Ischnura elegans]